MASTVGQLTRPGSAVRGHGASPQRAAVLIEPLGEVVDSLRPTFRWIGDHNHDYVVIVSASDEIWQSDPLRGESWTPVRPLKPGLTYSWQLEVKMPNGSELVPRPPDPPVFFRTLTSAQQGELKEARDHFPGDHLLLAVLYARFGVLTRADDELRRYVSDSKPPNAESLLSSLHSTRAAPR